MNYNHVLERALFVLVCNNHPLYCAVQERTPDRVRFKTAFRGIREYQLTYDNVEDCCVFEFTEKDTVYNFQLEKEDMAALAWRMASTLLLAKQREASDAVENFAFHLESRIK